MPELPEVETIRKDLSVLEGKRIISIPLMSVRTAPLGVVFFKKKITGRYIKEIKRRGKLLIFSLFQLQAGENVRFEQPLFLPQF